MSLWRKKGKRGERSCRCVGDVKKEEEQDEEKHIIMIRGGRMVEIDLTTTAERRGGSASCRGVSTQKTEIAL